MEDTGRIRRPLSPRARRIVFGESVDRALADEMPLQLAVDRAHAVMLVECGVLSRAAGARLLAAMDALAADGFAPLRGRSAPRGLYLLYEDWLIDTLGDDVGGSLHLARSRNDVNATVLKLRLRAAHARLVREALRLAAVLVHRAEQHVATVMPVYTHAQAALPVTFGHWLAGLASAVLRDVAGLEAAASDLARCPLGAGAAGGTTLPIDPTRTARLLGFDAPVRHSIDAVASRDAVLRVLASAATLGVTLSRLATDLQLWSTAEFDLVRFPDSLVGSSSMMPQKRNAFLLEHLQGRAGAPLGAFTAAAMAMHATPFSNSVAVGTEGVKPAWSALEHVTEAVELARLVVAGAEPRPARMRERAEAGFTAATELANRLVVDGGMPFRRAHHRVGQAVTAAADAGEPLSAAARALGRVHGVAIDAAATDPSSIAAASAYGGGPAALRRITAELRAEWSAAARRLRDRRRRWREAERALDRAAAAILVPLSPPLLRGTSGGGGRGVGAPSIAAASSAQSSESPESAAAGRRGGCAPLAAAQP